MFVLGGFRSVRLCLPNYYYPAMCWYVRMAQSGEPDVDHNAVSYVISSQPRVATVEQLLNQASTPSEIGEGCEHDVAHISRALSELVDEGVVELLVDEDRKKGRLYGLTENGYPVAEYVADRD